MQLTHDNYFSKEMDLEYMSVSQFKNFEKCESKALNDLKYDLKEEKEAFLEGQFFEAIITGNKDLFLAKHPELISTRGATAGQLKSNFLKVVKAAEKFIKQDIFKKIIDESEKQVILTGEIDGVKVKGCLDFFLPLSLDHYDSKCMANFKDEWSSEEKSYVPWYYKYDYVLQLAVYEELIRQNYGEPRKNGLMAATKEDEPDLNALSFSKALLSLELDRFKSKVKRYDLIKKGFIEPIQCGTCDYCKSIKEIKQFEVIE